MKHLQGPGQGKVVVKIPESAKICSSTVVPRRFQRRNALPGVGENRFRQGQGEVGSVVAKAQRINRKATEESNRSEVPMGMACRRWYGLCVSILSIGILALGATQSYGRTPQRKAQANRTLRFEAKRGQTDEPVQYVARSADFSLFLTGQEADVVLHHECEPQGPVTRGKVIVVHAYAEVLRLRFVDANPPTAMAPVGGFPSSPKPSRSQGRRARPVKHPSYAGVAYLGIYPGTDLVFHGTQHRIGFELYFSPGADPNAVVLRLDGATGITLDHSGNAVVHIGTTSLVLERPSFYTGRGIGRHLIPGGFKIEPNNRLRFLVSLPKRGGNLIED